MSKIGLVIAREYTTRVRNKVFWISTIIGPLIFASFIVVPILIAVNASDETTVLIKDDSGLFANTFEKQGDITYKAFSGSIDEAKAAVRNKEAEAVLIIPKAFSVAMPVGTSIYSVDQMGAGNVSDIENLVEEQVYNLRLERTGIRQAQIDSAKANINLSTFTLSEEGTEKEKSTGASTAIAAAAGLLMYMFIFLYGMQVLRGVVEEKANRVVEVIISSVKPFELMMGKILGIAAVGLTQFMLWIVLTFGLITVAGMVLGDKMQAAAAPSAMQGMAGGGAAAGMEQAAGLSDAMGALSGVDVVGTVIVFLLYFIGGYLFYASLFAAVGGAVDQESDAQSLLLPITMPIIVGFLVAQFVLQNPTSNIGLIFSMVPFTSPIVMMARLPFKESVFDIEVVFSLVILYASVAASAWLGGRIYRAGIMLYGKKPNLGELFKWVFAK